MKNAKRWLAVILAVTLLGSNAVYQLGTTLSANETEAVTESQQDESENAVAEQAEKQQEDTGKATVQEVTPQEDKPDASAQEASNEQAQQSQPAQAEANTQEAQEAAPANAGQSEPEANQVSDGNAAQAETPVAQTYDVKINKPELDGGQIKVWGTDGIQTDVTSYDGNNQYVKEVTEGEDFNFQITRNDGFEIENVTVNGAQIAPESTDGNVSTYKLSGVAEEKAITITYNKVETPTEDEQTPDGTAGDEAGTTGTENDANVSGDEPTKVIENLKPAKTLSETVDGTIVTVSAPEGALEDGWTLQVKKVSVKSIKSAIEDAVEDADAIEEIKAFDITIYDKDGNAIQPDGSVQVSFSGTGIKGDAAEVYHVDDSKKKAEKVCDATTNSKVEFEAEHFSIYAVVGSNTVYANTKDKAYKVAIGSKLTLKSDNYKNGQEWTSDESSIVEVVDSGTTGWMNPQPYAIVKAKSEGTTFVKYNKEKFYITVTKANGTLSFDLNGGTGTKPADITGENGESVTLPTGNEITRENYTFLGWSTEKDANLVTSNGKAAVYPAGGTFEVSGKTTLYAVWAQSAGKLAGKIAIAIRKDGTIPGEPSLQYASYTFLTSSLGNSTLMSVDNVLDYINPAQTMVGKSNVESVLQPTFYSYVNNKNANGTYWNNDTQYVEWYVVKYQNSDYAYHIDGVVRDKSKVHLDYDGNGYTDGLVPDSIELFAGNETTVSQAGNYFNGKQDWRELKKAGYTFTGWNTNADGTGTTYQPGTSMTVNENTTLYAQWKAKGYTVKYDSDGGSAVADKNQKFADKVDVTPTPTKAGYIFEGWSYNGEKVTDATYASLVNNDESVQEITLKAEWTQKDGRFGYYLSLKNASWKDGMPDNLEVSGTSGQGLPKYAEKIHYSYGDKYNVISNVPEATGHAFIGWLDKKRGGQSAAIRSAGDELTYIYKAGDENQAYTLDALWASIAATGGEYTYNGTSHQITADIAINEGLNLNEEYVKQAKQFITTGKMNYSTDNKTWSEKNPSFTDAGTYTVYVKQDVTVGGTTTTLQSSAQIVINPRNVELTSATASKTYDGKALTKKEVTASGDGFITGEGATYNVTGSQKVVGSSENTFTYTLTKATKAENYNITTKYGTLTVTNRDAKYEITVKANSTTGTYNGTEYSAIGLESTTFTVDGNVYTVSGLTTEDPKQKNAGTYTNNITGTAIVKDAEGNDVTDQFLVKTSDGSLVIKKAEVTLKSATLTKQYDGDALVNGNTALEIESGWAEGEGADYHFTGSQTLVGSSENTFTYTAREGTNFNNYTIKPSNGTLTVTNRDAKYEITVKANSTKATYDGKKHKAEGVETYEFTINNHKYTVSGLKTEDPEHKNAGTYTNNITGTAVVMDEAGNDVSSEFLVKTEDGSLKINKAKVTLKSADLNKKYDGKALVNGDKALATETGWAEGEGADYTFTGSQTLVGSSANSFTYKAKAGTNFNNYEITANSGTLTVTSRDAKYEITVKANSTTGTYNGTEYSAIGLESTTFTVDGNVYTVEGLTTEDPVKKDAGTYTNNITGTAVVKDAAGNDVSSEFAVNTENGSLKIKKAEVTLKSATLSKVYEGTALVNGTTALETEEGWAEADKDSVVYNFTGSQTYVGSSENTFSVVWNETVKESNYNVAIDYGTLTVTPQSIVPDPDPENPNPDYKGVEVSTPADVPYNGQDQTWKPIVKDAEGKALVKDTDYTVSYDKDDRTNVTGTITVTITGIGNYTGTVTRTYQITPKPVTITTNSDEKVFDNTALTADGSVEGIVAGETYSFTVTGSQTWVGRSDNTYEMVWATEDNHYTAKQSNYTVSENVGTLTVTDGTPETPVDPSLVVNKTHEAKADGTTFKAGDVITFTITVKNIYDEVKTITLAEQEGVTLDQATFENVQPGAEITATATYTVTEVDIVNGTFTNNVTARFSEVDKEYTGTDTVDEFEDPNPHMTITKTTKDVEENHIYKLGETISYVITVKNDGNLTLTNVRIEDALTGNAGENAWTIDTFAPGETQTFEASYVVTEADVIARKVVNNATGEAENPDPKKEETPVTPGEKEDPVETPNPGLTVVKTSDTEGQVTLGQKIPYTITVTNNGNVTISGVKLVDPLTRDNWTIDKIKPGETVTKKTTYTVTEKDIIAGKVENHATATGKDPSGNDVTGKGDKTVETEPSNPHITVTKETTSTPKNGETYALGEEITYKITAKNTGNLTLKDVVVSDELTGNTGDKAFKIDGEFKPGDEKTFETSYTVTEADLGKTVVNVATATGKTPDPDKPKPDVDPGKKEDPTDQKKPAMSIEKKVIDQKEKYEIGDTVKYKITVTNTGNTTQNNILVEDQMSAAGQAVITKVDGANGTIDGAKVTLDTLAPGKAATITAEYTVVKADRGNKIINVAVAKGEGEIPKTPEVPVQVEEVYDIHVVHAFAPGNEGNVALPDDYTIENLKPGTVKSLMAKGVTGYVAYPAVQNATVVDRDITVTFLYYKDEIGTDPTNPDKPDGVPDEFQRVVRFVAVNGTVSIDHAVVTLFGEDGKPAKNGVGHLSALQIAAATANAGYDQASLSWAPQAPTMDYNITGDMTFTATFTATPVTPPATPDNPRPNNPTRPSGQTTEPTGNAFVDNVVTPVVETVKEKAAKIQEVFNSDDEDVPLADQNLDNHKCCILHFLIMLITLLVYALATKSMKKRQKKLHEVREELDCELARRGLPLSREKE